MTEPAVLPVEWVSAETDRDHLVDLGRARLSMRQRLVDLATTDPAVRLFGQDAAAELVASVTVGATRVSHR
jgi:hypothetical protein